MLNICIIGPGLVGKAFLQQMLETPSHLYRVTGIISSTQMRTDIAGVTLSSPSTAAAMSAFIAFCAGLQRCVLVDCTSSQSIAEQYPSWLRLGLSIVTPNKKAFSSSQSLYDEIISLSKGSSMVYHESSVGAGLPVLSTLKDLIETGDKIESVTGILSGTLSFIFNTFSCPSNTLTFSEIVNKAKALGYTEPVHFQKKLFEWKDPRDDLNGIDVARKVVILARMCGQRLEIEDVQVQNIVPNELRNVKVDEFMQRLQEFDHIFEKKLNDAKRNDVGVVEFGRNRVELIGFPISHPFAGLAGSDNVIQIKSRRFSNSLIIQGAGAGDEVTAFGIFSDILKIVRSK